MTIHCPVCDTDITPVVRVGALVICPTDGSSLIVGEDGTVRRAVAIDVEALTATDQTMLRRARATIVRPERKR